MIITRLNPRSFGKFEDFSIDFEPGFNLVYGPNEAGKSTLLTFLEFMLFGAKIDGRTRKQYLEAHARLQPWDSNKYDGFLRFVAGEKERHYEVYRNFDKDADVVTLHDAGLGKDLSENFVRDKRNELLFAQEIMGLTRPIFLNTIMIPQLALKDGFAADSQELSAQIIQALSGSQDDRGTDAALSLLEKALEHGVGKTERGKRSAELLTTIEKLEKRLERAETQRIELSEMKESLRNKRERQQTLTRLVSELEQKQAAQRKQELQKTIEKAERLSAEIQETRKKAEDYLQYREFPMELAEEVDDLERRKNDLVTQISEVKERRESALKELKQYNLELMPLDRYIDVEPAEKDHITELKFQWRGLLKDRNELQAEISAEQAKNREKHERYSELNELFNALGNTVDEKLETMEKRLESLDQKMVDTTARAGELSGSASQNRSFTIAFTFLGLILALASILFALWDHTNPSAIPYVAAILDLVASVSVAAAIYFNRKDSGIRRDFDTLQHEYEEFIEERRTINRERSSIFSLSGVSNLREFFNLQSEYESLQREQQHSATHINEKRLARVDEQESQVRAEIVEVLRSVGLCKSSDMPTENDIELFRANVDKTVSVVTKVDQAHGRVEEITKRENQLVEEQKQVAAQLKSLYSRAGIRRYVDFQSAKEGRIAYDACKQKISRNEENLEFLLKDTTLSELKNQMAGLEKVLDDVESDSLFDGPFRVDELNKAQQNLARVKEDIAELDGSISTKLQSFTDPAAFELEIADARLELEAIRLRRAALVKAIETIENSREELHADFAPQLNEHIGKLMESITAGRYDQVLTSDDFTISVRNPKSGAIVSSDSLSCGTRDQLYFAARLAIAEVLSTEQTPLPLFFDDCFVEYDFDRASESFQVLSELSKGRQIIFFTCHERERDLSKLAFGDDVNIIDLTAENHA